MGFNSAFKGLNTPTGLNSDALISVLFFILFLFLSLLFNDFSSSLRYLPSVID